MSKPSYRVVGFMRFRVVCVFVSAFYIVRARNQVDPKTGLSIYPRESPQAELIPSAAKEAAPVSGAIANSLNKLPVRPTPSDSSDSKGLGEPKKVWHDADIRQRNSSRVSKHRSG